MELFFEKKNKGTMLETFLLSLDICSHFIISILFIFSASISFYICKKIRTDIRLFIYHILRNININASLHDIIYHIFTVVIYFIISLFTTILLYKSLIIMMYFFYKLCEFVSICIFIFMVGLIVVSEFLHFFL